MPRSELVLQRTFDAGGNLGATVDNDRVRLRDAVTATELGGAPEVITLGPDILWVPKTTSMQVGGHLAASPVRCFSLPRLRSHRPPRVTQ